LITDTLQDSIAIVDDERRITNENRTIVNTLLKCDFSMIYLFNLQISQQLTETLNTQENETRPSVFDSVVGGMTVKVQPKANPRSRYATDGARFLPGSRRNPMSITVSFSFFFAIKPILCWFFSYRT
jgi:hypothetical protein